MAIFKVYVEGTSTWFEVPVVDPTLYLLLDGTRAMAGPLNMGGYAITSVGNVDGRDVSADGTLLDTALQNVVEDTSPQAGGEFDFLAHSAGFTQQTATGDGTTTIDWTAGNKFKFTFGAMNETFTFSPAPSKPCNLLLMLVQDGVGGRTATWPAMVKWPGGVAPALSSGASEIDIVSFYYNGTSYHGQIAYNFS